MITLKIESRWIMDLYAPPPNMKWKVIYYVSILPHVLMWLIGESHVQNMKANYSFFFYGPLRSVFIVNKCFLLFFSQTGLSSMFFPHSETKYWLLFIAFLIKALQLEGCLFDAKLCFGSKHGFLTTHVFCLNSLLQLSLLISDQSSCHFPA